MDGDDEQRVIDTLLMKTNALQLRLVDNGVVVNEKTELDVSQQKRITQDNEIYGDENNFVDLLLQHDGNDTKGKYNIKILRQKYNIVYQSATTIVYKADIMPLDKSKPGPKSISCNDYEPLNVSSYNKKRS